MFPRPVRITRSTLLAILLALIAGLLSLVFHWSPLGTQVDHAVYDALLRGDARTSASPSEAVVLAIDERTLREQGGPRRLRPILTQALCQLSTSGAASIAIDSILSDDAGSGEARDRADDAALARCLHRNRNVVLAAELDPATQRWEEPMPSLAQVAAAIAHVHAEPDSQDAISRIYPLAKAAGHKRYWALALESYRVAHGSAALIETPDSVATGLHTIPTRASEGRPLLLRARAAPVVSLAAWEEGTSKADLRGKAVFVGVTAISLARDRLYLPSSQGESMAGVEIHALAYETIASGRYLQTAPELLVVALALAIPVAIAALFALYSGWLVWLAAALILACSALLPSALFTQGWVLPPSAIVFGSTVSTTVCGVWRYIQTSRRLEESESARGRYQRWMQFVTHEMRTPLTAIQGSSELMGRYQLSEEKRKQIAQMIHSESKRLGRMISTFLEVERLNASAGELKREPVAWQQVLAQSVERARPLAERKSIRLLVPEEGEYVVAGDRELLEYAVYNLVTNAIKYSGPETEVRCEVRQRAANAVLSVSDQGMGMEPQEVKMIFQKFYRTSRAEQSGEAGTGIGLSLVREIIERHGGKIEVESAPQKGSQFRLILPLLEAPRVEGQR